METLTQNKSLAFLEVIINPQFSKLEEYDEKRLGPFPLEIKILAD
jgi:hypothetical protein